MQGINVETMGSENYRTKKRKVERTYFMYDTWKLSETARVIHLKGKVPMDVLQDWLAAFRGKTVNVGSRDDFSIEGYLLII
jgi:hypothetical protein